MRAVGLDASQELCALLASMTLTAVSTSVIMTSISPLRSPPRIGRIFRSPQAMATKYRDSYYLQVVFDDETISLSFPSNPKRTAERWAEGIRSAALGDLAGIRTEETLPPEIAGFVDGARDVFGSIFAGGATKKSESRPSAPTRVNGKCIGCRARSPTEGRTSHLSVLRHQANTLGGRHGNPRRGV